MSSRESDDQRSFIIGEGGAKDSGEGFVRWQTITRDQLGSVIKLVLGLTTVSIGFGANLLVKRTQAAPFGWLVISMLVLVVAAAVGVSVNITRLLDFRWTTRAAGLRRFRKENRSITGIHKPLWLKDLVSSVDRTGGLARLKNRLYPSHCRLGNLEFKPVKDVLHQLEESWGASHSACE